MRPRIGELRSSSPHRKPVDPDTLPTSALPILAFDPGVTTGWSLLVVPRLINGQDVFSHNWDTIISNIKLWEHGELLCEDGEDDAVYILSKLCTKWPSAAIVVEDFILRAERKEKSRELLSPVRITAKLETYMWRQSRPLFKQPVPDVKGMITDDRLAVWKCLVDDGLNDHARDADRHAVYFLRRCLGAKGVSVKRAALPHVYGEVSV